MSITMIFPISNGIMRSDAFGLPTRRSRWILRFVAFNLQLVVLFYYLAIWTGALPVTSSFIVSGFGTHTKQTYSLAARPRRRPLPCLPVGLDTKLANCSRLVLGGREVSSGGG